MRLALRRAAAVCALAVFSASALQSGDPGFGWQWVRENPFGIQAVSLRPATWDISEYFGAGMTLLNRDMGNPFTTDRPPAYANKSFHAFVTDESVYESMKNVPGNTGWLIRDEPSRLAMPSLAALAQYVRQRDPQKVIYTTGAHDEWGAAAWYGDNSNPSYNYSQYLDDFINIINPDILTFDKYSLYADGSTNAFYLRNLMTVRSKAIAKNLPYWAWIQSFGATAGRAPSESDNRWNVYTHLTMGYTGMLYWTYDHYAGTGDGMIDINGSQTPLYSVVAQTNQEAATLGNTLRFLRSTDVRFIPGKTGVTSHSTPAGLTNWSSGAGSISSLLSVSVNFSNPSNLGSGKDGLIGFFTDDSGAPYFMLTNLYHGANLSAAATSMSFTLSFDNTVNSLLRLNRTTGQQEVVNLTNHVLSWTLPGGTGDLFRFNNGAFVIGANGWAVNASGDWNAASNWSNGVPNGVDAVARLGGVTTSPQTIFTNSAAKLGKLVFDSANTYQIAGNGSLTIDVTSGLGSISVVQGGHKINLPLIFADDTNVTVASGATLTIANPATIKAGKTVTKSGNLIIQAPLSIEAGGSLVIAGPGLATLAGAPSLAAGASVDVQTNALTVNYHWQASPADTIRRQLASGFHNGAWDGAGINTSSAITGETGLGWRDNVTTQTITVGYTWYGDMNLDGSVDSTDFNEFVTGFGMTGGAVWAQGDFNFDQKINTLDFNQLAGNFGKTAVSSTMLGATVPEPAALLLAPAAILFSRRCGRRSNLSVC